MSIQTRLSALITAIGADIKALFDGQPVQLDHLPDPATNTAADVHDSLVALRDDLVAKGWMAGPPPVPMGLTGTYPNATVGEAYSHALTLTGDYTPPVTFSILSGAVPAGTGWAFDTDTSELDNAEPVTEESATFVVRATDSSVPTPQTADSASQTVEVETAGGTPGTLGDTGSGGAGNWPTSGDRALLTKVTIPVEITLTEFGMRIRGASTGVGDRFKGLIYAADGADGEPGTLLAVSDPTGPTAGGAEVLTAPASGVIAAQEAWIGYVCDGGSGSGSETDSGGTATNVTIMLNGGETDYASPNDPCGNWPGGPGPYSNIPALWFDYTA